MLGTFKRSHADPWITRHDRRERAIRAALHGTSFAFGALSAVLLVYLLASLSTSPGSPVDAGAWIEERIKNALWGLGSVLSESITAELAREYPYQTMLVIGGMAGFLVSLFSVGIVYRRFFDSFDPRVLAPVGRPTGIGFDGLGNPEALPWIQPCNGGRKAVWDELHRWVLDGLAQDEAFGWRVLLGRPGAGKTRTAHELARLLARRDVFGTPAPARRAEPLQKRMAARLWASAAARRLAIGAYFRNLLHWHAAGDPWDVGYLHGDVRGRALLLLSEWRPRRPTLVLLDDPDPTLTSTVLTTLLGEVRAKKRPYRYPVRLLVVNQTIPGDVGLRRDSTEWESTFSGVQAPIAMPEDYCFTPTEVRRLANQVLSHQAAMLLGSKDNLEYFMEVTAGTPLLVELGLRWLGSRQTDADLRRQPLSAISREGLLRHRAIRICRALETAKAGDDSLLAIAASTLCGGGNRTTLTQHFRDFSPERLARAFPLDMASLANDVLPPIRPEMIGDEFVRAVARDSAGHARQIVRAAWFAQPEGTLRAVLRLSSGDDLVAQALREGPPMEWAGNRIAVAKAYAMHCVQKGTGIAQFEHQLGLLTPAEAEQALGGFADLLAVPGHDGEAGLTCFVKVLERAMAEPGRLTGAMEVASAVRKTADAIRWADQRGLEGSGNRISLIRTIRHLLSRASAATRAARAQARRSLTTALDALEAAALGAFNLETTLGTSINKRLSTLPFKSDEERQRLRVRALAMRGRVTDASKIADRLSARFGGDTTATPLLADVLCAITYAMTRLTPPGEAQRAEELAIRVAGLPNVRASLGTALLCAQTWRVAGYLWAVGNNPASAQKAERCAREVEAITAGYADNPELVKLSMKAWLAVIFSLSRNPGIAASGRTRAIAEHLEVLAGPSTADLKIRITLAEGWHYVIDAHAMEHPGTPEACSAFMKRIDTLAEPSLGDSSMVLRRIMALESVVDVFRVNHLVSELEPLMKSAEELAGGIVRRKSIALALASLRRTAACTFSCLPNGDGVDRSRANAHQIDELAELHAYDESFDRHRVAAWVFVVISLTTIPEAGGITEALAVAGRVDEICQRSRDEFAIARAMSWRMIGELFASFENFAGAARAAECATHIEALSSEYPHDREIQQEQAWATEAALVAYANLQGGVGIADTEELARDIGVVAARFPEDERFCLSLVRAMSAVAVARANRRTWADAERARAWAADLEGVAAPHLDKPKFAYQLAQAWRAVTHAFGSCGGERGTEIAEAYAMRIDALTRRFQFDGDMAKNRAEAWEWVAVAKTKDGVARRTSVAATRLHRIATEFCGTGTPALTQAEVLTRVIIAYTKFPDGGGLPEAKRWIEVLDTCVGSHCEDVDFALQHARAWRHLAEGCADAGGSHAHKETQMATARVDAIVEPLALNPDFILERILAWRAVIAVQTRIPSGPRIEHALSLARQIDTWAGPFARIRSVAVRLASVFDPIILACANQGPLAARSAEECVARVELLLAPFTDYPDAVRTQLGAWRLLVATYVNWPSAGYIQRAEEMANRAERLTTLFNDDAAIGWECAEMWYYIVRAIAPHDPAAAQRFGAHAVAIAGRFPDTQNIQETVRNVERSIASAPTIARGDEAFVAGEP